jgi:hypothetical protein
MFPTPDSTLWVEKMDETKARYRSLYYLTRMLSQWVDYTRRYDTFIKGTTLSDEEWGDVKAQINFFYRFCKTHSSFVVKDCPNINVPADYADQIESKLHASKIEKFLTLRWKENSFPRKLKIAALRWSIFGDMYFTLNNNVANKCFDIEVVDPSNIIYDTVDSDLWAEIKIVLRVRTEDTKILKKQYPAFAERISPSSYASELININAFTKSALNAFDKSLVCYLMDKKYIYTLINGLTLVDTQEHGYDYIPLYHRPYIDVGDKYGKCVVDIIYEPVKYMQLALSYVITNAYDLSTAPLISDAPTPQISDQKGRIRGLVTLPKWSQMTYLQPPQSNLDLYKVIEFAKTFMHFVSGISEEAMAGFTWALTSAGVSIELRMDSTVRETLDCQITLQDILQKMNADVLRLYEKFYPKQNIFQFKKIGTIDKALPFTGSMIMGKYNNIVDFGGILPRSDGQITQQVVTKYKMGLISQDTALEELRYEDPTLEISKIYKEQVDKQKLQMAVKEWTEWQVVGFEWPKDENYYMLTEGKPVPVLPNQNHQEHFLMHSAVYQKTKNPLILMHMQLHESMYKQWAGLQVQSPQWAQEQVKQYYDQWNPQWGWQPPQQPPQQ